MSRKSIYFLGYVGLLILLVHPFALAQLSRATISGTVTDETGGVLPGVSITIENLEMGTIRETVADDEGRFFAPNLLVGPYSVRAELPGFSTSVRTGIQLTVARNAIVDLTLQVGEMTQEVTVTGEAPLVETTNSTVGGLVEQSVIEELPLKERSYDELTRLIPGVTRGVGSDGGFQGGFTSGMSIRGARIEANKMLLDGTDVQGIDNQLPGSVNGVTLGVDAIREFKVEVGTYGAEFGRALGGVINVTTRSGSNEFHGTAFEFLRNDNLDAAAWEDNAFGGSKGELKRNQFGFSIGGPIAENQTFFFASYEGLRDRRGDTEVTTVFNRLESDPFTVLFTDPSDDNFPSKTANPIMEPYLDLYPFPNTGEDFGDGSALNSAGGFEPANEDFVSVRVDHTMSQSDSLFVSYTFDQGDAETVEDFVTDKEPQFNRNNFLTIEETRIFSPTLFNTLHFGFARNYKALSKGTTSRPAAIENAPGFAGEGFSVLDGELDMFSGFQDFGVGDKPRRWGANKWQLSDQVVLTRGQHTLKIGVEGIRFHQNFHQNSNAGGEYRFKSIEEFLDADSDRYRVRLPGTDQARSGRNWYVAWYVHDTMKVTSNLTLNLGLRHEIHTGPTEVFDRCANLDSITEPVRLGCPLFEGFNKNFSPRIGFAWDVTGAGKSALRGGFGVFFSEFSGSSYYTPFTNQFPLSKQADFRAKNAPAGIQFFPNAFSIIETLEVEAFRTRPVTFTDLPYTLQFSLTLDHELRPNLVASVGYAGTLGRHWVTRGEENVTEWEICPGVISKIGKGAEKGDAVDVCSVFGRPDGVKFFPEGNDLISVELRKDLANDFLQIRRVTTNVNSSYHGLLVSVKQRLSAGLSLQGSYTLSKSLDALPYTTAGNMSDFYDWRSSIGLSDSDIRHNLSVAYTWALPGPADGAARTLLGGWQVGGIVSLASGHPFTALNNDNVSNDEKGSTQERADLVTGFSNNPTSGVSAGCTRTRIDVKGKSHTVVVAGGPLGGPDLYYDPCAFASAPDGFHGNLGRNTLVGPGLATADFSLTKNFDLSEDTSLQFRTEFFNLLNRPNFDIGTDRDAVEKEGIVAREARITDTTTSARQIQFGLKLYF